MVDGGLRGGGRRGGGRRDGGAGDVAGECLDAGADGLGEGGEVVAAFEKESDAAVGVKFGDVDAVGAEVGKTAGCEVHGAEGVVLVGIESSGDEYELGFELVGDGKEDLGEGGGVVAVGSSGGKGNVDVVAGSVARAEGVDGAGFGKERRLVDVEGEDVSAVFEAVLGAVAVVDVPVDDEDAFDAELFGGVGCGNGDVVEDAKSHGVIVFGVVAGWADQAEGAAGLVVAGGIAEGVDGLDACAGSKVGGFHAAGGEGGVAVEVGRFSAQAVDQVDVAGIVDAFDVGAAGGYAGVTLDEVGREFIEHVGDGLEAFRDFGVKFSGLVVEHARVKEDQRPVCHKRSFGNEPVHRTTR